AGVRRRRDRKPRAAGPRRELAGRREGVQVALGQLVAARRAAHGEGEDDDRRRERGARGMTGFLLLEDGTLLRGESAGAPGFAFGEAVFTTAMTGYQEVVTDPSYAEQLVAFTAPMIGNYGVARERSESARPQARGVVMREARGPAWTDWLLERSVPALSGVDTRSLVLRLREAGALRAALVTGDASVEETLDVVRRQPAMAGRALAAQGSTPGPYAYSERGGTRVAVVDYGCKRSILRRVAAAGAAVTVFPHTTEPDEPQAFDGVLPSNRPGAPETPATYG